MARSFSTSLIVLTLCSGASSSNAFETYGAQGLLGGRLDLFLRGFVDQTVNGVQGAAKDNVAIKFDWNTSTGQFQSFDFVFSGGAYQQSRVYTTGPGQTKTITATVNVNPFTVSASDFQQFGLTPGLNGLYNTQNADNGTFNALPLSGNVVISGPTQTATVPFSVSIPSDVNFNFPALFSVDTSSYPTTLLLDVHRNFGEAVLSYWFVSNVSQPVTLANATVDGINVGISTAGGYAATTAQFNLHQVPEPTVSLLLLLGASVLVFRGRLTPSSSER
jgi:hypothetical protein